MKRRSAFFIAASSLAVLGLVLWVPLGGSLVGWLLRSYTLAFCLVVGVWLVGKALRRFLWRVSRRLAFSYFLIGIVPIPLALVLGLVAFYIFSGFFFAHMYRDALASLTADLRTVARQQLELLSIGVLPKREPTLPVTLAYYRDEQKIAGDDAAPEQWQPWWPAVGLEPATTPAYNVALVAGEDGAPTVIAAVRDGAYGILAVYAGELDRELSERSGVWVELLRSDDPSKDGAVTVTVFNREYPIKPLRPERARREIQSFFSPTGAIDTAADGTAAAPELWDRPLLIWVDVWQPFVDLATGEEAAEYVSATLTGSLRSLYYLLIASSAEVGNWAYLIFVGVAFLLFDIYVIAASMALLLIFGLSRAVNRLTDATWKVQHGDFSARIEVNRSDQVGALQTSFNRMSANLEDLVAQAAQKEILEKDLSIARELQHSLLPDTLLAPASLCFATHFEPSAAIGGDYYDLLPRGDRLAVFIADVSGHGISAGLRMAMVKSALQVLCEREHGPEDILRDLHRLLRAGFERSDRRGFVTATLTVIDSRTGELTVTNAGHPPTYLLRAGKVTEILLPSSPLGVLRGDFAHRQIQLEPNDVVLWLSDGLIEATGEGDLDFGYDRILTTLTGLPPDPTTVRDRLLAAVAEHTQGRPPADDRTLVVMAYRPEMSQ